MSTPLKAPGDYRVPKQHPHELLFLAVAGSHAFGFNSPDSDYDLRGAHICPTRAVFGIRPEENGYQGVVSIAEPKAPGQEEMVTHEIGRFLELAVSKGGSFLEHVMARHLVATSPFHRELASIAPAIASKKHVQHYLGFAQSQMKMMNRRPDKAVKIYLYILRTLMSGITLARDGFIEPDITQMIPRIGHASFVFEIVRWKRETQEEGTLPPGYSEKRIWDLIDRLEDEFKAALDETKLPDQTTPAVVAELNRILLEARVARL